MTIIAIITNILGLVFYSYLVWVLYQLYLAAWGKENAKEPWLRLFNGSLGLRIRPYLKWLVLIVFSVGAFTLILYFINVLMKFTLAFMGSSAVT